MLTERSCIVCRKKAEKTEFFRLCQSGEGYHWDKKGIEQARGAYVCKSKDCLSRLSKHKKIKVGMEDLYGMSKQVDKEQPDYLKVMHAMKQSGALTFGMNMVLEQIDHSHFLIVAQDISPKYARQLEEKAKEKKIPLRYFGTKKELASIFGKEDVTVIAVVDKKMARGLVKEMK